MASVAVLIKAFILWCFYEWVDFAVVVLTIEFINGGLLSYLSSSSSYTSRGLSTSSFGMSSVNAFRTMACEVSPRTVLA